MKKKHLVMIWSMPFVLGAGLLWLLTSQQQVKEAVVIEIPKLIEADPHLRIRNGFDQLKVRLDELERQSPKPPPLVQGKGIEIERKEFLFYKFNVHLTNSLREEPLDIPDGAELLDQMVKKRLYVQQAIERGITVPDTEVDDFISVQQDMLGSYEPDNKEDQLLAEVLRNRIRITGLSDEEFWQSDAIRQEYRAVFLAGKHSDAIVSDGTVQDRSGIDAYIDDLFKKLQRKLTYNIS
ncbi:hypothetical protein ACFOQM_00870 [Paenibacillus sp. GCM10012307]|uniref:Uncharacterized protein n=1 Tax=Paenibacillus roseus TaxID=2798579 RepID=A0A934MJF6_9BACL|nr:hypothetical protein [Paenibacillus roseus]MBJ6359875.1 hypothetical protein [Paenibacillus roseus]